MAKWYPFGATNATGTCRWCGRKLRQKYTADHSVETAVDTNGNARSWIQVTNRRKLTDKPGDYGDGYFCGLRCAYQFAVEMAEQGGTLRLDE